MGMDTPDTGWQSLVHVECVLIDPATPVGQPMQMKPLTAFHVFTVGGMG